MKFPKLKVKKYLPKHLLAAVSSARNLAVIGTVSCATLFLFVAIFAVGRFVAAIDNFLYQVPAALIVIYFAWQFINFVPRVFRNCFYAVPTTNLGLRKVFERRTGEVTKEGLQVRWPLVENFDLIQDTVRNFTETIEFPDKSTSKFLACTVSVRYRIDATVKRAGKSVCAEVDEVGRRAGLIDHISQKLLAFGRAYDAETLLSSVPALADIFSCYARLASLPHPKDLEIGNVISWYNDAVNRRAVSDLLRQESDKVTLRSSVEELLGLDVLEVKINKLDLNKETKSALKSVAEARERQEILNIKKRKVVQLCKPVGEGGAGASFKEAVDAVEVVLDPRIVPVKISVQGDGSAVFPILGDVLGGKSGGGRSSKKGGK